uniref:Spheroide-like protein n=1 Tax=Locusta migratoria migratoria TaxID=238695 RepID=A0A411DFA8_LOCMI|nr:spheroide-like protein [Locusta migratoria migratoria]
MPLASWWYIKGRWRESGSHPPTANMMQRAALLVFLLASSALAKPTPARQWIRPNGRIIGGTTASIANYAHVCGGSILSQTKILTTASIISSDWVLDGKLIDASRLACRVGSTNQYAGGFRAGTSTRESGGFVRQASSGYKHGSFSMNTIDYDINNNLAVITLSSELTYTDRITAIGGLAVTVTGWGVTSTNGNLPTNLMKVDTSIVARSTCQSIFSGINTVTARMVCAGAAGKSVCNGDSGGPLVSGTTQVGIVSWGVSPCEASPGVYGNVGNLRSWITSAAGV